MTYGTKWLVMYVLSDFLMQETVYKWWPNSRSDFSGRRSTGGIPWRTTIS